MKAIQQRDKLGCSVSCVAFILKINYQNALDLFEHGREKANNIGFYCREITMALEKAGLGYKYKYLKNKLKRKIYRPNTIVFIRRSKRYPAGHYLCRSYNEWMNPWINFPDIKTKAGFRKNLPGRPIYFIYPT